MEHGDTGRKRLIFAKTPMNSPKKSPAAKLSSNPDVIHHRMFVLHPIDSGFDVLSRSHCCTDNEGLVMQLDYQILYRTTSLTQDLV